MHKTTFSEMTRRKDGHLNPCPIKEIGAAGIE